MSARGETIFELRKKLSALAETMAEVGEIKRSSLSHLATYARISLPTLKSASSVGKMTEELTSALFGACRIGDVGSTWIDRKFSDEQRRTAGRHYSGTDTATNFRRAVRKCLSLPSDDRRALLSLKPKTLDSHIAALALSDAGQDVVEDQAICVVLEVDMSPSYDPAGFAYGFKKVRIRLLLDVDSTLSIKFPLGAGEPIKLGGAHLNARGTKFDPVWELSVPKGILNGNYSTTSDPLCQIFDGQIGHEFQIELAAQLYDGSIQRSDGLPIEQTAREAIIGRLMAKLICERPNEHGWLLLGTQKLRIVRSDR